MIRSRWISCVGIALAMSFVAGTLYAAEEGQGAGKSGRGGRGQGGAGFMGGAFGGQSKTGLLSRTQVQDELKLTQEQKDKVREAQRAQFTGARGGAGKNATDEQKKQAQEDRKKAAAETQKKLEAILNADQVKRLNGIFLQTGGPAAFLDEGIAKELKITAEQKTKIEALLKTQQEEMAKLMPARGQNPGDTKPDVAAIRTKRQELQKETETKVQDVLTADQKTKVKELKGAEFKLEQPAAGAGGGGRGGRNRGAGKNAGGGTGT
jgi:Spy/CpxP family protein refolding chaperone